MGPKVCQNCTRALYGVYYRKGLKWVCGRCR